MTTETGLIPTHIGTKAIKAVPMTRGSYNDYRGWDLPDNEDGTDAGYLVEYPYDEQTVPNHEAHVGYISWSPAQVFDAAYQPTEAMSFGHALVAMQAGAKVARAGWNGKGMWIALTPASFFPAVHAKEGHAARHRADEVEPGGDVFLNAHIDMRTADGSMCVGWLASQTDMLANDWCIVRADP